MRSHPALLFHTCWLLASPLSLPAQAATCPDSIAGAVRFLQGSWEGRSYSIAGADTTFDGVIAIESKPVLGGCVLEERWSATNAGKALFDAKVLRAYDAPTWRWLVHYVDDQLNAQFYEGRLEDGIWRFRRTRMDSGKPIIVRLTWRPRAGGHDQLIERSRDAGKSWVTAGYVAFRPSVKAGG